MSASLSVVMGNFNDGRWLRQSLPAILEQSFQPVEVIVIDDGSTDNSVEIISDLAKNYKRLRLHRHETNRGIQFVIKRSLELVSGDYVYWAGADDLVLPGFFKQSMELLEAHPGAGLCSTLTNVVEHDGSGGGVYPSPVISSKSCFLPPNRATAILSRLGNWFVGNTTIFRRAAVVAEGGFPDGLNAYVDAFLSQVLALRSGACFIPQALGQWRRNPSTYSSSFGSSVEIQQETLERALALMQSDKYRRLFPERFVRSWKNEMTFVIANLKVASRYKGGASVGRSLRHLEIMIRHFPRLAAARRIHRMMPQVVREHLWAL